MKNVQSNTSKLCIMPYQRAIYYQYRPSTAFTNICNDWGIHCLVCCILNVNIGRYMIHSIHAFTSFTSLLVSQAFTKMEMLKIRFISCQKKGYSPIIFCTILIFTISMTSFDMHIVQITLTSLLLTSDELDMCPNKICGVK